MDGGAITVDAADDLRAVVDPHAFDRIVSNLLVNARPPRRAADRRVRGAHRRAHGDGRGPRPGHRAGPRESLFERFTRGETPSSEGAGLGLAIAQSYARAQGGTLAYEPAEPHGARFRVTFPG